MQIVEQSADVQASSGWVRHRLFSATDAMFGLADYRQRARRAGSCCTPLPDVGVVRLAGCGVVQQQINS
eukprot:227104-Pleurochrysis_carterae.AAC.1